MSQAVTWLVADDHPLFRQAIMESLKPAFPDVEWLEAENVEQLERRLNMPQEIELLLLDLKIPGAHGFSTLIHMRSHYPDLPVVIVSAYEDLDTIQRAIQSGASGFIPKSLSAKAMVAAVQTVLDGGISVPDKGTLKPKGHDADDMVEKVASLTPQQYRILMMFAEGLLNKQIAPELEVSEATVKAHATAIFKKLGVTNRTQAVIALSHLDLDKETTGL
ncbi:response regulator transcription factor [Corallincola luteus]|uniref:Response regulator transcription factor n=1 Tax=Corallincola luteus TaxID=1775177 RepID=A0ABY2AJL5_9GAMM|nr:response regulator transcription factor [Corallincola luteus]TCI01273.1 response regulator transcription factor [Corallincola luteus]